MTTFVHTAILKDINRQVDCNCGPGYGSIKTEEGWNYVNLGCHAYFVSGINLVPNMKTLKSLDKKDPVKNGKWGELPEEVESAAVREALRKYQVPEDAREKIYNDIVKSFDTYYIHDTNQYGPKKAGMPVGSSIFIFSDNINSYTPEFNKNSGIHDPNKITNFKTSDFIQWLVKKRIGVVFGSPVTRNQFHQDPLNYSLVQAWFWIPPNFAQYIVPDSHFVSNLAAAPTKEQWYASTKKAIEKENLKDSELDARLFKEGTFNSHKKHVVA